jgi:tight adherence protein B
LVQRTAGGNLSQILDTVAETMRERTTIRGEIKTLTAQQKMTGLVIGLLPVGVAGVLMILSPDYLSVLFTSSMGKVMLGMAVVLEAIGIVIIRRILSIEV